jgi:hypothetical protein
VSRLARPSAAMDAVRRALGIERGSEAHARLLRAQVELAWNEVARTAGLEIAAAGRVIGLQRSVVAIAAADPLMAQELRLRADRLLRALNVRLAGRAGVQAPLSELRVSVMRDRRLERGPTSV